LLAFGGLEAGQVLGRRFDGAEEFALGLAALELCREGPLLPQRVRISILG